MGSNRRSSRHGGIERVPVRDHARDVPLEARAGVPARPDVPVPVRVWIQTGRGDAFEANGEALAWTPRAVHVRYIDPAGREGFAWMWASAVSRR